MAKRTRQSNRRPRSKGGPRRAGTDLARDLCVHQLVEQTVDRCPSGAALVFGAEQLSYEDLDARANQLAHQLREMGAGADAPVAVCLPRSIDLPLALLATLKAGAGYVPLDISYPAERLAFMLETSRPSVLICDGSTASQLPAANALPRLLLDRDREAIAAQPSTRPAVAQTPETLAYVLFTSGSTGQPKGVAMPHSPLVNLVRWQCARSQQSRRSDAGSRTLQFSPISFDVSFQEIFATWAAGGTLVLIDDDERLDAVRLLDFIQREQIDRIFLPFVALQHLAEVADGPGRTPETLREVITAGEQLKVTRHLVNLFSALPACTLDNQYGPTECHVVTAYRLEGHPSEWPELPPIGRAIANTQIYLLDDDLRPVEAGAEGELYIGGVALARGYLQRPDLTEERFVADPFSDRAGARLYRTGDLARSREDGALEFLGRSDGQVKVRGYRIELGEIEVALNAHPQLSQTVVLAREDIPGEKRLVAYVVPVKGAPGVAELRRYLALKLPDYMQPAVYVVLDALPRTPSGKIDRRALPPPTSTRPDLEQAYVAPRNEIERQLTSVWSQLLQLDSVGIDDNFFELGGNSLLALQTVAKLHGDGVDLPIVALYEHPSIRELAQQLAGESGVSPYERARARLRAAPSGDAGAIAIIGLAGRFPGARDIDELWRNLVGGVEGIRFFEEEEIHPSIDPRLRQDERYVRARGVIEQADAFDAAFFGVNPRLAEVTDPQQRVMLELCWSALEAAGHEPRAFDGMIGVFAGVGNNSYYPTHVLPNQQAIERVGSFQAMISNEKDYVATRVAHALDLGGPALSIHTACSTSLAAICEAVFALRAGRCDMALAGGASITAPINSGYLYQEGAMLAPDGHCRPFDARAAGTTFSDGAGVVVLRRLADALAAGDDVVAVIRGAALNNDGARKASFTAPSVDGQALVVALAQADAAVEPESISYIEAHGTATPLGDPIEVQGLARAFGESTDRGQYCAIGSIKSNLGHLTAAAGVAGLIKTALALRTREIPPSINFERPNPQIPFEQTPFFINHELRPWTDVPLPRRAGISSFGVGGTNAHVVLEEAPEQQTSGPSRAAQLLLLSAKTGSALETATAALGQHLERHPEQPLADVAYTLQTGRRRFSERRVVVCRDREHALGVLRGEEPTLGFVRSQQLDERPLAFVFPGQGAQYVGMGANLYRDEPLFRQTIDQCAELLQPILGEDLRALLYPEQPDEQSAAALLKQTRITQPALFALELGLARLWISWGLQPSAMIGHSVGEFVAATLAGVFAPEDALRVVARRGQMMQELPAGSMLSVRSPAEDVEPRLPAEVSLAAHNGPRLCVVSGPSEAVAALQEQFTAEKIPCRPLHTSHAFHSAMMDPVVDKLSALVGEVTLSAPQIPFVSTATGSWITEAEATDPAYWGKHLRQTVRFVDGLRTLWQQRERILLEVGPRRTSATLALQLAATLPAPDEQRSSVGRPLAIASLSDTAEGDAEWLSLLAAVGELWAAGTSIDWQRFYARERRRRVALPTYPFERERFWLEPPVGSSLGAPGAEEATAPLDEETGAGDAPPVAQSPETQRERLIERLKVLFEETSGIDLAQAGEQTTFFEMGLDSLFLTQIALSLQREFGVKITFRQLLERYPTLGDLATHLEATLPSGASERVGAAAAAPELPPERVAEPEESKKGFGPMARIERVAEGGFTPEQQRCFDAFAKRYTRKTAGSKNYTERHRQKLADPRVVSGFRLPLKEIIYPIVVERSRGAQLWDIDGNEYIDLLNGFGSSLFGFQPDFIREAVREQLDRGLEIGPQNPLAGEVAELICELTGLERAAFCNTGSEAVLGALRVARTVTGRNRIALFAGAYHGIFDEVLLRGTKTGRAVPAAPGITPQAVQNALVLPYGADEALDALREQGHDLAAVLIEPVQSRRPELQPKAFLQQVRQITRDCGAAMIMDEVITGFRIHPGGAQAHFEVEADLATYGKIVGGGMPIGVIAGRADWIDALDGGLWRFGDASVPEAGVTYFAGTFVRHPLALAAAKASLDYLRREGPQLQRGLNARTDAYAEGINRFCRERGVPIKVANFGSLMKVKVDESLPFGELLYPWLREKGIHIWDARPSFLTTAHREADVERCADAFQQSVVELQRGGFLPGTVDERWRGREQVAVEEDIRQIPSTEAQREVWASAQMGDEANCAYNESVSLRLRGALDVEALREAARQLVQRHQSLHARVSSDGGSLLLDPELVIDVPLVDLSESAAPEREKRLNQHLRQQVEQPFDLERGPLTRVQLVRLAAREHLLVFTAHHIICDGWSLNIVLRDLCSLYDEARGSASVSLPVAERYSDYAEEEADHSQSATFSAAERYWLGQFEGELPVLDLPTSGPRPAVRTYSAAREDRVVDRALVDGLKAVGARHGASFVTTLLAAFQGLLYRLSGQRDLVVGLPAAGQSISGRLELVGHCVNLLPLRSRLDSGQPFTQHLKQLRGTMLDAVEHQRYTFGRLLQQLPLARDPSRVPLVPVMFNIDTGVDSGVGIEGLEVELVSNPRCYETFEIFLNALETGGQLILEWTYNTDLFDAQTMCCWIDAFEYLLAEIARDPERAIDQLPLLSEQEQRRLLVACNETQADYPRELTLHQLFERQVDGASDAVALVAGDERLTFGELERRSNQLAHRLREAGVRPNTLVAICLDRTAEMVVALLGVLKAGGAYVPLDPEYPAERVALILADARCPLVLTGEHLRAQLPAHEGDVVVLGPGGEDLAGEPTSRPDPLVSANDLAYVIYTSGSTGKPKGVQVQHRAVVNFIESMAREPGFGRDDALLAVTTLCFDISVLELFLPLSMGGRLHLADRETAADARALAETLSAEQISVFQATPATWQLLVDSGWDGLPQLRALCGGEALPLDLAHALRERTGSLWNMYGPTETTIWSTCWSVPAEASQISLGRPIANTQVYVLDDHFQPVPVGVPGELLIGGDGVTRGYRGRPELTEDRFVPDRFVQGEGRLLYRTGDLVRWRADGTLEYSGRRDFQVKVRGFRIELGEIEAVLAEQPSIGARVVVVREDRPGDKRLVAYYVLKPETEATPTELRKHLRRKLPEYMVPQHFVELDELPRTPNGKIDRKALPALAGASAGDGEAYVAPRTPAEKLLARHWSEALGVDRVSAHANFFDLGGHSLLSMRVLTRINEETGVRLSPRLMLLNTLEQIAPELGSVVEQKAEQPRSQSAPDVFEGERGGGGLGLPGEAVARGLLRKLRGKLRGS
jgi:amino acid adenylation domain-containing protein